MALEPIFHRPEHGTSRVAFEAMTSPAYCEVGASGRVYDRTTILEILERRYADPTYDAMAGLTVSDFACRAAGAGIWLVTYRLAQGQRQTRRLTVWRRRRGRWVSLYHQGTVIA